MMTRRFVAGPDEDGERLDVVLAAWLGESRSQAAARIDRGEVTVRREHAKRSLRIEAGDEVEVAPPPETPTGAAGVTPPPVRHEDEHLLVVAKPAGLVVHPGVGHPAGTLVQVLADAGYELAPAGGAERPGIVHRLDRDTSGLLVVAKTDVAHARLVALLKARDVVRRYVALAEGAFDAPSALIDVPIGRDPRHRTRFAVVPEGKEARTRVSVLALGTVGDVAVSLLECRLETGRTHQIRVHLSYAGHPVVGDPTYGGSTSVAQQVGLHDRPFLHAYRLAFPHPVTGEAIDLVEPLPPELLAAADVAGVGDVRPLLEAPEPRSE